MSALEKKMLLAELSKLYQNRETFLKWVPVFFFVVGVGFRFVFERQQRKKKQIRYHMNTPCQICYDQNVEMIFQPCFHAVVCWNCSVGLNRCPICRTQINNACKVD